MARGQKKPPPLNTKILLLKYNYLKLNSKLIINILKEKNVIKFAKEVLIGVPSLGAREHLLKRP